MFNFIKRFFKSKADLIFEEEKKELLRRAAFSIAWELSRQITVISGNKYSFKSIDVYYNEVNGWHISGCATLLGTSKSTVFYASLEGFEVQFVATEIVRRLNGSFSQKKNKMVVKDI